MQPASKRSSHRTASDVDTHEAPSLGSPQHALPSPTLPPLVHRRSPIHACICCHTGRSRSCARVLMLYTPEEDLPTRFKPSTSSESFVTASKAGAGGDALALGWAIDKLSKQAGFPRKTVKLSSNGLLQLSGHKPSNCPGQREKGWRWRCCCDRWSDGMQPNRPRTSGHQVLFSMPFCPTLLRLTTRTRRRIESKRADERMAVEAVLGEDRVFVPSEHERLGPQDYDITVAGPGTSVGGKEDVRLRISSHPYALYPLAREKSEAVALPAFCVVSETLPSLSQACAHTALASCL